ncbi:HNH endonuclease [Mycobacterium intracellulare]|uniref:HNH endonuclease n=1 Tax=Mycobacterium intracellulare TaxID=1767 RepID=UPI00398B6E95
MLRDAKGVCEIKRPGCIVRATDVDHKRRGSDHSRSNLQAACKRCHGWKSSREGVAQRRKLAAQRKRPPERHPGQR